MPIPIVICIHVEPDERELDPGIPKEWEGFQRTFEVFRDLRAEIGKATRSPVHFSWFFRMDPQIAHTYGDPAWAVKRYRALIDELELVGDEVGLHTHAWRWEETLHRWNNDMGNQDWVDHCVRMSFAAFRASLSRPCHSFAFGDNWMNESTSKLLERLGARYDLTAGPGLKGFVIPGYSTGTAPDYTDVPRRPYRPSGADYRIPGARRKRRLWIVPMSTSTVIAPPASSGPASAAASSGEANPEASPARDSGTFGGFLEKVDRQIIAGWAYDASRPDLPLDVEIHNGDVLLATLPANGFRPDLLHAGLGNGEHCFGMFTPLSLKDGNSHSIRAKVAGTDFELGQSPREIRIRAADFGEGMLLLNVDPWFMRSGVETLLRSSRPYLAMQVRTEVSLFVNELSKLRENFDFLLSHRLVTDFVFETPQQMTRRVVAANVTRAWPEKKRVRRNSA